MTAEIIMLPRSVVPSNNPYSVESDAWDAIVDAARQESQDHRLLIAYNILRIHHEGRCVGELTDAITRNRIAGAMVMLDAWLEDEET